MSLCRSVIILAHKVNGDFFLFQLPEPSFPPMFCCSDFQAHNLWCNFSEIIDFLATIVEKKKKREDDKTPD